MVSTRLMACAGLAALMLGMTSCKQREYNTDNASVKEGPGVPEDGGEIFYPGNLAGTKLGLTKMQVALTFDDGPSELSVPLAKFLNSKGIKANWFVNYKNASDLSTASGRAKIKAICDLGHEVGNHNFAHTYNTNSWSKLTDIHKVITQECPNQPAIYYRAPGGGWKSSDATILNRDAAMAKQYIGPIFWDFACDTEANCKSKDPSTLAQRYYNGIMKAARGGGAVILGHDVPWQGATVKAFSSLVSVEGKTQYLVDALKNAGVDFVLLSHNTAKTEELKGAPVDRRADMVVAEPKTTTDSDSSDEQAIPGTCTTSNEKSEYSNVRSSPSSLNSDNLLGTIDTGTTFIPTGREDNWMKFIFKGKVGYINVNQITCFQ